MARARPTASSRRISGERPALALRAAAVLRQGWMTTQRPTDPSRPPAAATMRSDFFRRLSGLEELDRRRRHHCGDRVLVDELRMGVAAQQDAEIIEPGDDALELDTVDEEDRDGGLVLADVVQKNILNILSFFGRHGGSPSSNYCGRSDEKAPPDRGREA